MQLTFLNWILASLPVLVVIILMMGFNWGGLRAGAVSWLVAALVSVLFFGGTAELLIYSQAKALSLALDVLYIVWSAMLLYSMANEAGAIKRIGIELPKLASDRVLQVYMIAWMLPSFLQGMGGFGVPMAISAPILVALGYTPVQSVVMAALGHAWAVNFGTMSAAFYALTGVTGLPESLLAAPSALFLGLILVPTGLLIAFISSGWKGVRHAFPAALLIGSGMALTQYLFAVNGMAMIATTGAVMVGTLLLLGLTKFKHYQNGMKNETVLMEQAGPEMKRNFGVLMLPYVLVFLISFAVILITPLHDLLNRFSFALSFPEIHSNLGWVVEAEEGKRIAFFSHPGTIMLFISAITAAVYSLAGYLDKKAPRKILTKAIKGSVDSSIAVLAMVGVATIMIHSGMTRLLAYGLSVSIHRFVYPLIVPFIGVLGAFLTGSNNNSNVLFAVLHMETAKILELSIPIILAAQTAGGSIGSVMAPAKIIVGCTTTGLTGKEGNVLRKLVVYDFILVAIVALAATIWAAVLATKGQP